MSPFFGGGHHHRYHHDPQVLAQLKSTLVTRTLFYFFRAAVHSGSGTAGPGRDLKRVFMLAVDVVIERVGRGCFIHWKSLDLNARVY